MSWPDCAYGQGLWKKVSEDLWCIFNDILDDILAGSASGRTHHPPFASLDYIATITIDIKQTFHTTDHSRRENVGKKRYRRVSYLKPLDSKILSLDFAITRVNPPGSIRSPLKHSETWSFETSSNLIADTRPLPAMKPASEHGVSSKRTSQKSNTYPPTVPHLPRSLQLSKHSFVSLVSSNLYYSELPQLFL